MVCSQLLKDSAVQIHAKLSVSQKCDTRVFCLSRATLERLKAFHSRHEMSCCCFYFCCDSGVVTLAVFKMDDLNFNT